MCGLSEGALRTLPCFTGETTLEDAKRLDLVLIFFTHVMRMRYSKLLGRHSQIFLQWTKILHATLAYIILLT